MGIRPIPFASAPYHLLPHLPPFDIHLRPLSFSAPSNKMLFSRNLLCAGLIVVSHLGTFAMAAADDNNGDPPKPTSPSSPRRQDSNRISKMLGAIIPVIKLPRKGPFHGLKNHRGVALGVANELMHKCMRDEGVSPTGDDVLIDGFYVETRSLKSGKLKYVEGTARCNDPRFNDVTVGVLIPQTPTSPASPTPPDGKESKSPRQKNES